MYSAKNSLKAWISNASGPSIAATLAALPEGEIGFFDALGAVATTGPGYICYRKPGGQVLMSKLTTFSAAWKTLVQAYAAPTLEVRRVVIPTPAANTTYQIRVEMKWPGMQGDFIKHANYVTGSVAPSANDLATYLRTSLTNAFNREDKQYFTVGGSAANVDLTALLLPYVRGKKQGRPISFKMSLVSPASAATLDTIVTPGTDGSGYGPYICEQEFFAQGDHDPMRFGGYPNSFDDKALTGVPTGRYKTLNFTENTEVEATGHGVLAPQQYLLAFNTIGVGVVPIISAADGTTTDVVSGTGNPGDRITVYDDGVAFATTAVVAGGGTWSITLTGLAAASIVTATATAPGGAVSALSAPFTAT